MAKLIVNQLDGGDGRSHAFTDFTLKSGNIEAQGHALDDGQIYFQTLKVGGKIFSLIDGPAGTPPTWMLKQFPGVIYDPEILYAQDMLVEGILAEMGFDDLNISEPVNCDRNPKAHERWKAACQNEMSIEIPDFGIEDILTPETIEKHTLG